MRGEIRFTIIILIALNFTLIGCEPKEVKQVRKMSIEKVDLSKVSDGIYKGNYAYGKFLCEVEVTVKNNKIDKIEILERDDKEYTRKAEGIIERVKEAQSLEVDTVSGATASSKAFLKAIENALKKGLQV